MTKKEALELLELILEHSHEYSEVVIKFGDGKIFINCQKNGEENK